VTRLTWRNLSLDDITPLWLFRSNSDPLIYILEVRSQGLGLYFPVTVTLLTGKVCRRQRGSRVTFPTLLGCTRESGSFPLFYFDHQHNVAKFCRIRNPTRAPRILFLVRSSSEPAALLFHLSRYSVLSLPHRNFPRHSHKKEQGKIPPHEKVE